MKQEEYKKVSTGLGQEIRDLMNGALADARYMMGRAELNERLAEMLPGEKLEPVRAALATKFKQMAQQAQDRSTRFELRGRINELALHVVTELEKFDRLVAVEADEEIDVGTVAEDVHYGGRIGGELDRKRDKERAEAQEILRKAQS